MTVLLLLALVVFFLLGIPIFTALTGVSIIYVLQSGFLTGKLVAQRLVVGLDSFLLLAIPFFILAGELMNQAGVTKRIFRFASCFVGRIPGGLGVANVLASLIFAGMSGSGAADVGGLGAIEIKAMTDAGYDREFSTGITVASALVGPIIPPSILMVLFASTAGASLAKMFLGGVVPGLLLGLFLIIQTVYISKKRRYPISPAPTLREFATATVDGVFSIVTPGIILGGIAFGIVTPTEASALAVVYALFLGVVVYRELTLRKIVEALKSSARLTATIAVIIAAASTFSLVLTYLRVPHAATDFVLTFTTNRYVFALLVTALLLLIGCFVDPGSAVIVLAPILVPVALKLGFDMIHFGLIMVLVLQISFITPPVGVGLFIGAKVGGLTVEATVKAVSPFFLTAAIVILLILFVPQLVTFVPGLFTQ